MIQFYAPDIETSLCLGPEDSAHCCRVLRMKAGDTVHVVDGRGGAYDCVIAEADHKKTLLDIRGKVAENPSWWQEITIAVAPTKNIDRLEWLVEKAVEIGVGRIVPVICRRSERKVVKTDRLRKIAVSAMKQSLKSWLPEIADPCTLKDFIAGCDAPQRFFGYCDSETERLDFLREYAPDNGPVAVVIGPEGDFSPEEVAAMRNADFIPVTFGSQRLRTETAALYAVTATHVAHDLKQ